MTTTSGIENSGLSVIGSRREDVERCAGDLAGLERLGERHFVEQPAAGDVQDPHPVAHLGELGGAQEAFGLGRLRQVDRDEVGLGVDVVGAVGLLDAELAVALGADERVEGQDPHAEAAGALGDELPDAAEAEDAERLLVDLHAGELRALPFARPSATRRPAGCCAPAPAAAPSCARRPSRRSTRGRWRRRSHAWSPRGRRRCRRRRRRGRSRACARPGRSAPPSASSPSGSGCRRTRRSARPAPRRPSRSRARRRSARAAARCRSRRSSP